MAITIIEISDYYLTITQGDKQFRELGCCLVENEQVLFGETAWQQQLLKPLQSYNNYWQQLGYEKIHSDNSEVEHFADLTYLQLKKAVAQFEEKSDVVLLVSGHYNCDQLALLLGIVEACHLTVIRLINNAVVQLASFLANQIQTNEQINKILYLDIDLHQMSVSELSINGEVKLSQYQSFHQKGLLDLVKHLARWVNEQFILEYRYDAFDCAHTEQDLFNQIIELLPQSQVNYSITIHEYTGVEQENCIAGEQQGFSASPVSNGKSIVITESQLQQQVDLFFNDVFEELMDKKSIVMSSKVAQLIAHTAKAKIWQQVPDAKTYSLLTRYLAKADIPEKIELVSHLALSSMESESSISTKQSVNTELASHLVDQGRIYPLQHLLQLPLQAIDAHPVIPALASTITIEKHQQQWFLQCEEQVNILVNDMPVNSGCSLTIGDQITLPQLNKSYTLAVLKGSDDLYGV